MGIPGLFFNLVKKYGNTIIRSCDMKRIDNLYFDFNGILHTASRLSSYDSSLSSEQNYSLMYKNIIEYTNYIINEVKPTNMVYIAIDGVAPMAKIKQQRLRRFKTTLEESNIDFNMISPGTKFMKGISEELHREFRNGRDMRKYIISDDSEPSEGEHKIIKHIRERKTGAEGGENSIIYGMDADLIILTLSLFLNNIWIVREDSFVFGKNIDRNPFLPRLIYMDIYTLRLKIIQEMSNEQIDIVSNTKPEICFQDGNRYIVDYIFLSFFIGNDFIPSFEAIKIRTNGVEELINIYTTLSTFIINEDYTINYQVLKEYVSVLEQREVPLLSYHKYMREKNHFSSEMVNYKEIGDPINIKKSGWIERYYTYFFYKGIDKKTIFLEYIEH